MPTILIQIFEVCVIPLLGILTAYIIKWINAKSNELRNKTDNELADKYIAMLTDTIAACVSATTQTYVDSLKASGKFDKEAQKEAFNMTYQAVIGILTNEAKEYLASAVGDLQVYVTNKIEAEVKAQK